MRMNSCEPCANATNNDDNATITNATLDIAIVVVFLDARS